MRHVLASAALCISGFMSSGTAGASTIGTELRYSLDGGTGESLNLYRDYCTVLGACLATYDPNADQLSIPGAIGTPIVYWGPTGGAAVAGQYSLYLSVDSEGELHGGSFQVFGSAPTFGITQPTLLYAATVNSAAIGLDRMLSVLLETAYVDSRFGTWGPYTAFVGALYSIAGPPAFPVDRSDYFTQAWSAGPGDYWTLYSVSPRGVHEPASIALAALALGFLAIARLRRAS